jgi:predicted nucleic acid-binding protein
MNGIDTTIWIYSHDGRDPRKQQTALQLIAAVRPLALPWQAGCEFIASRRKLASQGLSEEKAWQALEAMRSMADVILLPVPELWAETQDLQRRYSLSFWDALLLATCLRARVRVPYTEDIGAPRLIDGLSLVNPFVGKP